MVYRILMVFFLASLFIGGLWAQSPVCFNSRDPRFRTPLGPVIPGTPVSFRFLTPAGTADKVTLVYGEKTILDMVRAKAGNEGELWAATVTFTDVGVVPYWFLIEKAGVVRGFGNNQTKIELGSDSILGLGGEGVFSAADLVVPYRQTVYDPSLTRHPDGELPQGVVYHLLPDRFKNGNKDNDPVPGKTWFYEGRSVEFHSTWGDSGPWTPGKMKDGNKDDDDLYNNDFYGGDLEGVIQKLDLIASYGTTHIWLNPIFLSPSNHKYDTSDMLQIDPALGDLGTFKRLVAEAGKRGMRIILDVCFNHGSSDSPYLDRYSRYPQLGALEGGVIQPTSPYADWFEFNSQATEVGKKYTGLLGLDTMPVFTESKSFRDFVFGRPGSVTQYWLSQGIGGFRMDVADQSTQDFWGEWRAQVSAAQPRAFKVADMTIGATEYLARGEFDSVNSLGFRFAALNLAKGGRPELTRDLMEMYQENTPPEAFPRLLNLISNHDTPRALWELGYKTPGEGTYVQALSRYKMALVFQFTMPGLPVIYYGDEAGVTGGRDPFNKGAYPWAEDGADTAKPEIGDFYRALSQLRKNHRDLLTTGALRFPLAGGNLLAVERTSPGAKKILILYNNGEKPANLSLAELRGMWIDLWSGQCQAYQGSAALEPWGWKILQEAP